MSFLHKIFSLNDILPDAEKIPIKSDAEIFESQLIKSREEFTQQKKSMQLKYEKKIDSLSE